MTPTQRKLAAHLLRLASDQFSNHGCNDFDLSRFILDQDERDEFVRGYFAWNGDPEEYFEQSGEADYRLMDFMLMDFLANRLEAV
jgi:hypothetical protein